MKVIQGSWRELRTTTARLHFDVEGKVCFNLAFCHEASQTQGVYVEHSRCPVVTHYPSCALALWTKRCKTIFSKSIGNTVRARNTKRGTIMLVSIVKILACTNGSGSGTCELLSELRKHMARAKKLFHDQLLKLSEFAEGALLFVCACITRQGF